MITVSRLIAMSRDNAESDADTVDDLFPDLDAQSTYSGDSHGDASVHSGSRRGVSEDSYSTVSDEPAITLLNFRRFSKIQTSPIVLGSLLGLSDADTEHIGPLPNSPKIITRKVVKDVDGRYRLETQTGSSRSGRTDLNGRSPDSDMMASSLTDDNASETSGSTSDRLSLPNSRMRYSSDPSAETIESNLSFNLQSDENWSPANDDIPKSKRSILKFSKAPATLTSFFKPKAVRIQEELPPENTHDTDWLY